jgi:hypothetical protein
VFGCAGRGRSRRFAAAKPSVGFRNKYPRRIDPRRFAHSNPAPSSRAEARTEVRFGQHAVGVVDDRAGRGVYELHGGVHGLRESHA